MVFSIMKRKEWADNRGNFLLLAGLPYKLAGKQDETRYEGSVCCRDGMYFEVRIFDYSERSHDIVLHISMMTTRVATI